MSYFNQPRGNNQKYNSFATKTASIQLKSSNQGESTTSLRGSKYGRYASPNKQDIKFSQSSKSKSKYNPSSKQPKSPLKKKTQQIERQNAQQQQQQDKQFNDNTSEHSENVSINNISQVNSLNPHQQQMGNSSNVAYNSVNINLSKNNNTQLSRGNSIDKKINKSGGTRNQSPNNTYKQSQQSTQVGYHQSNKHSGEQQQLQQEDNDVNRSHNTSIKQNNYMQSEDEYNTQQSQGTPQRIGGSKYNIVNSKQNRGLQKQNSNISNVNQSNFGQSKKNTNNYQNQMMPNYDMDNKLKSRTSDSLSHGGGVAGGEFFQVSGQVSNIKTYVRFRPINKMEQELTEQGIGSFNVSFPNDKTVKTHNDNNTYTFDKMYKADVTQATIYKEIFSEKLDDALNGYNATLFAYGPTGSGKTWTMFGPDLEDVMKKGIIPRMAENLFDKIDRETQDVEYNVQVSMMEIYRENLLDLVRDQSQDLKIKESPKKGVYISGLSWHQISSVKDLLELIQQGYDCKKTRETKLNEYSSRSHTILQLHIEIKHNQSGAEKAGKLNLIDLAGSEKVWKSQAEGESLEEAKKINLSLSCLGNVINALTTKSSHIPYRDSKLTRILQESLGGNFKTSIIVACSPHSHMQEETTMALRFASRAKTIKNYFNMNIKQSQETLRIVIDQLKAELHATQGELTHYKKVLESTREELSKQPGVNRDAIRVLDECMVQIQQQIALPPQSQSNLDEEEQQVAIHFLSSKNANNEKILNIETKQLREQISEKNVKIEELDFQLLENKKKLLDVQQRLTDLQEEKNQIEVKYSKEKSENQYKEFQIDILNKQLQSLVQKVCKNEQDFAQILKERKELTESKIEDYLQKELKFQEIKLSDYFKNSCNFNFDLEFQKLEEVQKNVRTLTLQECDQNMLKTFASDIQNLNETFVMQTNVIPQDMNQSFIGNLDFGQTISSNQKGFLKTIEFPNQLEQLQTKGPLSKDLQLILMKQQVVNSHIINQHLLRTINALEWKQVIEYGKYKMNSNLNTILSGHVSILEKLLKQSQDTHKKLRKRFDQIEFEHSQVRNQLLGAHNTKIMGSQAKRRQSMRASHKFAKKSMILSQFHNSEGKNPIQQFENFGSSQNQDLSWVNEISEIVDDNGMSFQLIYNQEGLRKAQDEIKRKTELLKKCWDYTNVRGLPNQQEQTKDRDADEQTMEDIREKERLQNKIVSLDQELITIRAASNQYKKAFIEEKKMRLNTKKLMEELEIALRNNLREENETWQNTIQTIREQYDREIMLRQVETTKLQEKYQSLAYHALNQVQKLKLKQNIDKSDIDSLQSEMIKLNEIMNSSNTTTTQKVAPKPKSTSMAKQPFGNNKRQF